MRSFGAPKRLASGRQLNLHIEQRAKRAKAKFESAGAGAVGKRTFWDGQGWGDAIGITDIK
jgi:hypothetical protein